MTASFHSAADQRPPGSIHDQSVRMWTIPPSLHLVERVGGGNILERLFPLPRGVQGGSDKAWPTARFNDARRSTWNEEHATLGAGRNALRGAPKRAPLKDPALSKARVKPTIGKVAEHDRIEVRPPAMVRPGRAHFRLAGAAANQNASVRRHRNRLGKIEIGGRVRRDRRPDYAAVAELLVEAAVGKEARNGKQMSIAVSPDHDNPLSGVDSHRQELKPRHLRETIAGSTEARIGLPVWKQAFDFTFGNSYEVASGRLGEIDHRNVAHDEGSIPFTVAEIANDPVTGGENQLTVRLDDQPLYPGAGPTTNAISHQAIPAETAVKGP